MENHVPPAWAAGRRHRALNADSVHLSVRQSGPRHSGKRLWVLLASLPAPRRHLDDVREKRSPDPGARSPPQAPTAGQSTQGPLQAAQGRVPGLRLAACSNPAESSPLSDSGKILSATGKKKKCRNTVHGKAQGLPGQRRLRPGWPAAWRGRGPLQRQHSRHPSAVH